MAFPFGVIFTQLYYYLLPRSPKLTSAVIMTDGKFGDVNFGKNEVLVQNRWEYVTLILGNGNFGDGDFGKR